MTIMDSTSIGTLTPLALNRQTSNIEQTLTSNFRISYGVPQLLVFELKEPVFKGTKIELRTYFKRYSH